MKLKLVDWIFIAVIIVGSVFANAQNNARRGALRQGSPPTPPALRLVDLPAPVPAQIPPHDLLFAAIAMIENGGDRDCCLGTYAITEDYWIDGTGFGGVDWDYETLVWSDWHCRQVMQWYWQRYGAKDDEDRARMHKGGWSMQGTDDYTARVQALMEAM